MGVLCLFGASLEIPHPESKLENQTPALTACNNERIQWLI